MPGIASATGLLEARIRPINRPIPKRVQLLGSTKPAPFVLRPFSGLFNPYPYGCSVLCNHPADCEAKEILKRAKDSWANEGKTLLLPEEMEMIRASLITADVGGNTVTEMTIDTVTVPEKLFRKYTQTDSRPLTPAPTLASGPALTNRPVQEEFPVTCDPRERTTLVLDLRANAQKRLENDTFTWHALTLEPPPTHRKAEILVSRPMSRRTSDRHTLFFSNPTIDVPDLFPSIDTCDEQSSDRNVEKENEPENRNKEVTKVIRRRGKRLRKGKCRRGSVYGQQTEVRDLFEPTETQVSHVNDSSRRTSIQTNAEENENEESFGKKASALNNTCLTTTSSFLDLKILKELGRDLDSDTVEAEFSIRRKIVLEEALRIKGESFSRSRRPQAFLNPALTNTPRAFSRQTARFEILGSESLRGLSVLDYLRKHVSILPRKKLCFAAIFDKFQEDVELGAVRYISSNNIFKAFEVVLGKSMTNEQQEYLKSVIGEIKERIDFRTWCGLSSAVERLICPLPSRDLDPPPWLERVDFEALERRLESGFVETKLAYFLREIRDK